jgi:hypothetical protein
MAEQIVRDAIIYVAQYDLSGSVNALALNMKAEAPEKTAMGATAKTRLPGLNDHAAEINGWWSAEAITGNPDHYLFDQMGLAFPAMSLSPTGLAGAPVFLLRPELTEYSPGAKMGDVLPFKLHAEGAGILVRGLMMLPKAARTLTGAGSAYNLGEVSSIQNLYGILHVFSKTGTPTLDVVIAIANRIATVEIHTAGSGYSEDDILTVVQSGASGGTLTVDSVGGSGEVTGVSLLTPGSGYAVASGLSTTVAPPGGSGCKITILTITDTAVITFAQKTDAGYEWKTETGPYTDVWWKAKYTIGGDSPNITFAVTAGIAAEK